VQVLVDTSVWSLALRRPNRERVGSHPAVTALRDLIADGRAVMIGAIRQELLSGIRFAAAFEKLRDALRPFDDLALHVGDYELAAQCFNTCRGKGVQGAPTDLLLCAVAQARRLPILTTDRDFALYKRHLSIELFADFVV
jgi:predicted nucleic acid-binding protein